MRMMMMMMTMLQVGVHAHLEQVGSDQDMRRRIIIKENKQEPDGEKESGRRRRGEKMKDEVAWRNVKCSLGVCTDLWIYG